MSSLWSGVLRGAAAGAAGTTALNATTYLDMVVRGRPASTAPESVVARLADEMGVDVPGGRRVRANRLAGLGPLSGIATGVGVGVLAGALRSAGLRLPTAVGGPLLGAVAMAASDLPMALLRVGDPRRWSVADWIGDVVPHLVYGVATHATLVAETRPAERAARDRGEAPPRPQVAPSMLLRAAALGAASGSRSSAGVTAVALTSSRADRGAVASRLGGRAGTVASGLLAASELVADKLPGTPSRLAAPGLLPRVALGGTSAAAAARRDGYDATLPALTGAVGAVGTAIAGNRLRGVAARRFGSDRPGAVAEDVVAALLGWAGARRSPRHT